MFPEQVIISYTSKIPFPCDHKKYPFQIKTIYRGKKPISQINQLLMSIYEEQPEFILMLDDDDMVAPNLIRRHYETWRGLGNPENFYFQCGLTRGCKMFENPIGDATKFDKNWQLSKKLKEGDKCECECDYGGSCCSFTTLSYYLKLLLVRGYQLESFAADVFLFNIATVDNIKAEYESVNDRPNNVYMQTTKDDPRWIHKYRLEEPLYYHRRWRDAQKKYIGTDGEVWKKIREIKRKQKY